MPDATGIPDVMEIPDVTGIPDVTRMNDATGIPDVTGSVLNHVCHLQCPSLVVSPTYAARFMIVVLLR